MQRQYDFMYSLYETGEGELMAIAPAFGRRGYTVEEDEPDGSPGVLVAGETATITGGDPPEFTVTHTGYVYEGGDGFVVEYQDPYAGPTLWLVTNDVLSDLPAPEDPTVAPTETEDVRIGDTESVEDFSLVCFLPGTRIATPDGERAIETLELGDLVTLASGEQKPLRWVGRMTKPLHPFNRRHASPILVKAGALGEGLPRRDLYTSYRHGFALEGVLVIAGLLVNGTSIVQCTDWPEATVTYYQLEVEGHELMLAEGAATETFGEDGDNRALFDNAAEFHALYPDAQPCEPMALGRVIVARQVPQAVRARLAAAAAELQPDSRVA